MSSTGNRGPGTMEKEKELKKSWLQMGVELEGSWVKNPVDVAALRRGALFHKDESVHIGHGHPGEIVTRPHDNLLNLIEDIRVLWPDTVDQSCGYHIHASFSPMQTSLLATQEFYSYFKDQWKRWGKDVKLPSNHEFWNRLNGKNKHARDSLEAERQLSQGEIRKREDRYTMVNFHSWQKHKTVEVRLLPMFSDVELVVAATQHMAFLYDSFLAHHEFKNIVIESPVNLDGTIAIESYETDMPSREKKEARYEGTFPSIERGADVYYALAEGMDEIQPFKLYSETQTP